MDISIFDVIGPVMIGPSSSHTAGAARLSRIAAAIVGKSFHKIVFDCTGLLPRRTKGMVRILLFWQERWASEKMMSGWQKPMCLRIRRIWINQFEETELEGVHENSVRMTFYCDDGDIQQITGSSVGGGQIQICRINDFETEFSAGSAALLINHRDEKRRDQ